MTQVRRDYPDRPIVGVGAVVWVDERVVLIKRGNPPREGQWSLPGGAQHLGETVEETARREVREETGIEVDEVTLLTVVNLIDRDDAGLVRYHYTLIDFSAVAAGVAPVPGSDASDAKLFTMDEVEAMHLWVETKRLIRRDFKRRWASTM